MRSFDEHLLEKRCLADEFGVLVRRAESQHRLARGGQIRHVALKYHCVRSRSVGFSSDDAGSARVEVLHEPLDRAALARRVAALEHEDEPSAPALTPILQRQQFDLQQPLLDLVLVAGHPVLVRVAPTAWCQRR
jgi:hypothetical protein